MVDNLALLLIHGLLALTGWRLLLRDDLDSDPVRTSIPEPGGEPAPRD